MAISKSSRVALDCFVEFTVGRAARWLAMTLRDWWKSHLVIAKNSCDEAIQLSFAAWIAS
jgi:hypothetical protein